MKPHDAAFNDQIEFLLVQYRQGYVKSIPDLMKLIKMAYGDYMEFHPHQLPEARHPDIEVKHGEQGTQSSSVAKES